LPIKCEALSANPSTTKKKEKAKEREGREGKGREGRKEGRKEERKKLALMEEQ
jgi:hypothetical protein